MNDTIKDFTLIFQKIKNNSDYRLKGAYTYDIKEDPIYKKTQKIEKRMRKYYAKQS